MALFIIAVYFAAKYLYNTLLKMAAGCRDPFNPLYSYRDYPAWEKGYRRGRRDVLKVVDREIALVIAELDRIAEKYQSLHEGTEQHLQHKTETGTAKMTKLPKD
jgi:hypothetical protein